MATEFGRRSEPQPAVGQFKTDRSHKTVRSACSIVVVEVQAGGQQCGDEIVGRGTSTRP